MNEASGGMSGKPDQKYCQCSSRWHVGGICTQCDLPVEPWGERNKRLGRATPPTPSAMSPAKFVDEERIAEIRECVTFEGKVLTDNLIISDLLASITKRDAEIVRLKGIARGLYVALKKANEAIEEHCCDLDPECEASQFGIVRAEVAIKDALASASEFGETEKGS